MINLANTINCRKIGNVYPENKACLWVTPLEQPSKKVQFGTGRSGGRVNVVLKYSDGGGYKCLFNGQGAAAARQAGRRYARLSGPRPIAIVYMVTCVRSERFLMILG